MTATVAMNSTTDSVYRSLLAASGLPSDDVLPTPPRMPYRPEAELKRPDLKGEFVCATCKKTFCHAASLNRHRLNFHGGNHYCTICQDIIQPKETVRRHMSVHGYERIFTCGCCNWAFPDKKELHIHTSSMAKTNTPGSARAIATTSSASGEGPAIGVFKEPKRIRDARAAAKAAAAAMAAIGSSSDAAAELSESAAAAAAAAANTQLPLSPPQTLLPSCSMPLLPQLTPSHIYAQLLSQLMAASAATPAGHQNAWLRALMANNPLLQQLQPQPQPQPAALSPLDTSSLLLQAAAAGSSGLPSASRSEAQDTESDRVSPTHSPATSTTEFKYDPQPKPLDIASLLAGSGVVQFAAKTPSSMSPMTSGLSIDDCSASSSPSSSSSRSPASSAHLSPVYEEKFTPSHDNAALLAAAAAAAAATSACSSSGVQHSIAALISPAKDSCSSSSSEIEPASSPEAARQTPSPSMDSRKRRRTINDVVSFLAAKKCKSEE